MTHDEQILELSCECLRLTTLSDKDFVKRVRELRAEPNNWRWHFTMWHDCLRNEVRLRDGLLRIETGEYRKNLRMLVGGDDTAR